MPAPIRTARSSDALTIFSRIMRIAKDRPAEPAHITQLEHRPRIGRHPAKRRQIGYQCIAALDMRLIGRMDAPPIRRARGHGCRRIERKYTGHAVARADLLLRGAEGQRVGQEDFGAGQIDSHRSIVPNVLPMSYREGMDLEAEYNNRARVPGHPAIIAGWMRDAAAYRLAHPPEVIPYGQGPRQVMDVFLPAEIRGVAIFFHGGYWQGLGREAVSHCASGLVAQGVAVAVPSYDLCPDVPLARIVAQAEAAVLALQARFGRPMLAMGHSAGGHLAAMLLARMPMVTAAIPISGLFWLEPLLPTSINTALGLDAETARELSPALLPSPGRPLHAVVGGLESDEFLRQSREFASLWGGGFEALPDLDHFTVLSPLQEARHPLTMKAAALAWLPCGDVSSISSFKQ